MAHPAGTRRLVRSFVPGEDLGRDAPPVGDLDALITSPRPDTGLVVPWHTPPPRHPAGRRHLTRCVNEGANRLSELVRVLLVQVDLIVGAAKSEPDCSLGIAAVNVIYVQDLRSLSH